MNVEHKNVLIIVDFTFSYIALKKTIRPCGLCTRKGVQLIKYPAQKPYEKME